MGVDIEFTSDALIARGPLQVDGNFVVSGSVHGPEVPEWVYLISGLRSRLHGHPAGTDVVASLFRLGYEVERLGQVVANLAVQACESDADHYTQRGWKECWRCATLFYDRLQHLSQCPAGGQHHARVGAIDHMLTPKRSRYGGQPGWAACAHCQALFQVGTAAQGGVCPARRSETEPVSHVRGDSPDYLLWISGLTSTVLPGPQSSGWRWCVQCAGMFLGPVNRGSCPAGGVHVLGSDNDYHLLHA